MGVRSFSIYDMICRNALLYPDREAIVYKGRRHSFHDFRNLCDSVASGILLAGLGKGDRIAVLGRNSDIFMALYGAAAKTGSIIVPVNWRSQENEIEYILRDSSPRLILSGDEYIDMVRGIASRLGCEQNVHSFSDRAIEGVFDFGKNHPADLNTNPGNADADDASVMMYTAAVGGTPRGALLSQANILAVNIAMIDLFGIGENDCNICFIPLFHIGGLSMCTAVMQKGGRCVIMDRFEADEALDLIDKEKVSIFFSFSPMIKMLTEKISRHDLSSIRAISGLEPPDHVAAFRKSAKNAQFYSFYGQTEAMAVTGSPMELRPGSIGRPTILSRVALFDEYDNEAPLGSAGEICVRSPSVFLGYWNLEEESSYTFRNNWHHTGDIGRFDKDGFLWYVKRKAEKELIKTGGENVYPAEVEKAILAHGMVAEVCVFGVADKDWGESIAAVIVLKDRSALQSRELLEFLAGRIPAYKRPKHIIFSESLPKTADGDIDRAEVRKEYSGLDNQNK